MSGFGVADDLLVRRLALCGRGAFHLHGRITRSHATELHYYYYYCCENKHVPNLTKKHLGGGQQSFRVGAIGGAARKVRAEKAERRWPASGVYLKSVQVQNLEKSH